MGHKKPGKGVKILLILLAFFFSPLAVLIMQYLCKWRWVNFIINLALFFFTTPLGGFIHGAIVIWTEEATFKKHSHRRTGRSTGHSSRRR
ncbi:uncharacterized protein FOMMEDRAFT_152965 [Fomitiporia mediterranea MF3/22]|uniref:uncharacterized protein n=1 Tax=Fomitiporia mediterranea (strain MF3/22) TaxID=694068 RepID=UPI0004408DE3|nr:uncharacterized protein FOMMEDRAFT_152965 [Fomitiporia mediterranea MF3/22]EJD05636.1 hypothetical protein FOMMEDRAFT_152965 [Fomitiporia mediterranea MF3/22]